VWQKNFLAVMAKHTAKELASTVARLLDKQAKAREEERSIWLKEARDTTYYVAHKCV
jgi:hypothetical protein